MNILLTGGLGYIGSHTAVTLLQKCHNVILYDNLSNSRTSALTSIQELSAKRIDFVQGNVLDTKKLTTCLKDYEIEAVIHFAGLKAVEESCHDPLSYYNNNVGGSISLLRAMMSLGINKLIFSSSATVYGAPEIFPISESHPTQALNPYGQTKLHVEDILSDLSSSNPDWRIACLRYFNPVGAHSSGLLGENPNDLPNNLMPRIVRVASGLSENLNIFGNDYPTDDGTCERDYIHIEDLAEGHSAALKYLCDQKKPLEVFNLGTGQSCSVLRLISIFKEVTGKEVPSLITSRRSGDAAICYADVTKSKEILHWEARKSIAEMCSSAWDFHRSNIVRQSI